MYRVSLNPTSKPSILWLFHPPETSVNAVTISTFKLSVILRNFAWDLRRIFIYRNTVFYFNKPKNALCIKTCPPPSQPSSSQSFPPPWKLFSQLFSSEEGERRLSLAHIAAFLSHLLSCCLTLKATLKHGAELRAKAEEKNYRNATLFGISSIQESVTYISFCIMYFLVG